VVSLISGSSSKSVIPEQSGSKPNSSTGSSTSSGTEQNTIYSNKAPSSINNCIVGYYTSWARNSGYTPDKINVSKLTHINYAFADISSSLKVVMDDPVTDTANLEGLKNLKRRNSSLKIIISVGGWDNSARFSDAAATESSRETFAQSCLDFLLKYGLDGVDLDWEYPVSGGLPGNGHRAADKQNYTKLVQLIRQKLNARSALDGKRYYLTVTGATDRGYIRNIELTSILASVDYLFIMGYDMHGPWDDRTGFNAPLYSSDAVSVNQGIENYLDAGAPTKKLVLGMPFYGYLYQGVSAEGNGLNSIFSSSKSVGFDTVVSNYLNQTGYYSYTDGTASVPYLYGNNTFISYEDAGSVVRKVGLAKRYGLAGVGIWELSFDKNSVLLNSAYGALFT
jgi:chitinase